MTRLEYVLTYPVLIEEKIVLEMFLLSNTNKNGLDEGLHFINKINKSSIRDYSTLWKFLYNENNHLKLLNPDLYNFSNNNNNIKYKNQPTSNDWCMASLTAG